MDTKKLDDFIAKVDSMKKQDKMDLSSDQDLSIAIMNLISIEEHFFFTGNKTDKTDYFDFINEVRDIRKELLKKIVKDPEGEVWCISKHLLVASMRIMEVGTKQLGMGRKDEAYNLFRKAYQTYSLFWGLNMGVIDVAGVKKIDGTAINQPENPFDSNNQSENTFNSAEVSSTKKGFFSKLGELVKKALDCCME